MPDTANMTIQLAYRDENGRAVYSEPVSVNAGETGQVSLRLDTRPRMGPSTLSAANRSVVIAVISNSDYLYRGESSRFAKYRYKIGIRDGVTTANVNTAWFNTPNMTMSGEYQEEATTKIAGNATGRKPETANGAKFSVAMNKSGVLRVNYSVAAPTPVRFDIYNTAGAIVKSVPAGRKTAGEYSKELDLRGMGLPSGAYIVTMRGAPRAGAKTVAFTK